MKLRTPTRPKSFKYKQQFLQNHLRYDIMNSWNGLTSFANKIKVNAFSLSLEDRNAVYDALEIPSVWEDSGFNFELSRLHDNYIDFNITTNGRSGGYLVLIREQSNRSIPLDSSELEHKESVDFYFNLVWEFDECCRNACNTFLEFARDHKVIKTDITVIKTIKVFAER